MTLRDFIPFDKKKEMPILERLDKLQNRTMTYPVLIGIGISQIVEKIVMYPEINQQELTRWIAFLFVIIGLYIRSDEKEKQKQKQEKEKEKEKDKEQQG